MNGEEEEAVQHLRRSTGLAEPDIRRTIKELRQAMESLALPVEGTLHRGVDDAWNTGLLLSALIGRRRARLMA